MGVGNAYDMAHAGFGTCVKGRNGRGEWGWRGTFRAGCREGDEIDPRCSREPASQGRGLSAETHGGRRTDGSCSNRELFIVTPGRRSTCTTSGCSAVADRSRPLRSSLSISSTSSTCDSKRTPPVSGPVPRRGRSRGLTCINTQPQVQPLMFGVAIILILCLPASGERSFAGSEGGQDSLRHLLQQTDIYTFYSPPSHALAGSGVGQIPSLQPNVVKISARLADPRATSAALFLCMDSSAGQDARPLPVHLCECTDDPCTRTQTADATSTGVSPMFTGSFIQTFQQSFANFTDLQIIVAQKYLRLGFYALNENGALSFETPSALSAQFSVDSGKIAELRLSVNPGKDGECPYCRAGAFLAGTPLPIEAGLYDAFGNVVAHCSPASISPGADCRICENKPLTVLLFRGGVQIDSATQEANFREGFVRIPTFNISDPGARYTMRYEVDPVCSSPQTVLTTSEFIVFDFNPAVGDSFLGGTTGDSVARLSPQPVIVFGAQPAVSNLFAVVCYEGFREDGTVVTAPPQDGLCQCPSCIRPASLEDAIADNTFLSGNLTAVVDANGNAPFTGIQTVLARPDLRILFYPFSENNITSLPFRSTIFTVTSGRLNRLGLLMDPADAQGCRRCPTGVYLAGSRIRAEVVLFDKYDNVVGFCDEENIFCNSFANAQVFARLFRAGSDVTRTAGQIVGSTVTAVDGTANFTSINVRQSNTEYYFVFRAEELSFPGPISTGLVETISKTITVVSSAPAAIKAVGTGRFISADAEVIPTAPQIEIMDQFGNRVINDCNVDPNCQDPNKICTLCDISSSSEAQGSSVSVTLITTGILGNAQLSGTTTASTVEGVATFNDLALAFIPSNPANCECDSNAATCGSCSQCYPNGIQTYTLQFSLPALGLANVQVELQYRVQKMKIVVQGTDQGVAREQFLIPMQVEVLDCTFPSPNRVTSTNAGIRVSLASGGAGGVLSGTLTVPIEQGLAVFSDLSIDLPGSNYVVEFEYLGNVVVSKIPSTAFTIGQPVVSFAMLASPELTSTVAGNPFEIQPQLQLIDASGATAIKSALSVTASIESDPGGQQPHNPVRSVLLGTTVVKAAEGKVRFLDLVIQKASLEQGVATSGFTLRFSQGAISIATNYFEIVPAAWSGLFLPVLRQPVRSVAGNKLAVQPWVYLVDRFNNRIRTSQVPSGTRVQAWLLVGDDFATTAPIFSGNPARLLRDQCNERCFGLRPTICTTCNDFILDAAAAFVQYNDLRVDIAATNYRLKFNSSGFEVTSQYFAVVNTAASTLSLSDSVDTIIPADQRLRKQPISLLVDRFNNPVTDLVSGQRPQVSAKLFTLGGLPTLPPLPPARGQAPGTICSLSTPLLRGTTTVNMSMGLGVFTDLMIVHAMTGYIIEISYTSPQGQVFNVNSTSINVIAGEPASLCALTLPRRCSTNSPCLDPSEVVCVDRWGNVQKTCHLCKPNLPDCDPFSIPPNFYAQCRPGEICVELATSPPGSIITSVPSKVYQGNKPVPFAVIGTGQYGGAEFDELIMTGTSPGISLRFFTFLHVPGAASTALGFEFISPQFNVTPAGPVIQIAQLSSSINQLEIRFNRPTNQNIIPGQPGDLSCARELDPVFRATLGTPHFCSWPSSTVLLVSFGDGATINPQTRVMLSPTSRITFSFTYEGQFMTSLPATTEIGIVVNGQPIIPVYPSLPPNIPVPDVQLSGLLSLGGCELINIDGSGSAGHAGRPFSDTEWSLDFQRSFLTQGIMSAGEEKGFTNRDIEFSNLFAEDENKVHVKLRPTAPIYPNSIVTISGLPGQHPQLTGCPVVELVPGTTMACFHNESLTCQAVHITGPSANLFVDSKAQWEGTSLKLKVKSMVAVRASVDCEFEFLMYNPSMPMLSEEMGVEVSCERCACVEPRVCNEQRDVNFPRQALRLNCATSCQDTVLFGTTRSPIRVLSASITETTTVVSAHNTITVTIVGDSILTPRSLVVIKDMIGLRTPSGPICIGGPSAHKFDCIRSAGLNRAGPCPGAPAVANWLQNEGSLTMKVRSGTRIEEGEEIVLQFELENADEIQREDCIARTRMECHSTIRPSVSLLSPDPDPAEVAMAGFPLVGDVFGSGRLPDFDGVVTVLEGNQFQGVTNLLVVGFAVTVALPEGAVIHFDWSDTVGLADGPVMLHGMRSSCLSNDGVMQFGSYTAASRKLETEVAAGCEIRERERLEIAFQVTNPVQQQTERTVTVSVSFPGCPDCKTSCSCQGQGKAEFLIAGREAVGTVLSAALEPGFESVSVKETVRVAQEKNTVSVDITSSASLVGGAGQTSVTITGLLGTLTPDSIAFPVAVTSEGESYSAVGSFQSGAGALVFELPTTMDRFSVSFGVVNGQAAVVSDGVFVSCDAQIDICGDDLEDFCDSGAYNNTRIISRTLVGTKADGSILQFGEGRAFVNASISELTRVSGAYNILTVRIKTNCEIPEGPNTRIEINGVLNTNWPLAVTSIIAVENMLDLFPNCACHQCEVSTCCTAEDIGVVANSLFLWTYNANGSDLFPFGTPSTSLTGSQQASGSWDPEEGKLILNILPGRAVPADTDLIFSFSVLNPRVLTFASTPDVTIVSDKYTLGPTVLAGSVLRADRLPFVTRFTVREENDIISNFNRLSVTFQANFPVFSMGATTPVRIIISDLRGYNLQNGYIPLDGRDANKVAKTGYGNWSSVSNTMELRQGVVLGNCLSLDSLDQCALRVPGVFDFTDQTDHQFSFVIKNTDVQISFQIYPKVRVESTEATTPLVPATTRPLSAANPRPTLINPAILQTSNVRQATNTLTVSFESNIAMYEGSTVTLRGLDNSASPSGSLLLSGPHAHLFTCSFNQGQGQIVLTVGVGVVIDDRTRIEVSFRLINPTQMQTERAIILKAFVIGPPVRPGCESPLLVSRFGLGILIDFVPVPNEHVFEARDSLTFSVAKLHESTTVSSAVNTITLTLIPKVDLKVGSVITLVDVDSPVKANPALRISGPGGGLFGGSGDWRYQFGVGRLVLTSTQVIEENQVVVVSFKLRNKECYGISACPGKVVTIGVNALRVGSEMPAEMTFESAHVEGPIFGGGSHLSWITKTVSQGSSVNSAPNRLVFSFRPNAPLYSGTKIRFVGLYGSETKNCKSCPEDPPFYDRIPQLGCSADCLECAPEELLPAGSRQTFTPCIPVFTTNNAQHPTFVINSEFVADDGMSETREGGVLGLTVAPGQKISELTDTVVVVFLQNSIEARYRDECSTVPPPEDLLEPRDCLRVRATTTSICSETAGPGVAVETCDLLEAPDGLPTGRAKRAGRPITGSAAPIDWYGQPLPDVCSDCVRPVDLVAVHEALETQTGLVLQDLEVQTPSLQGLPTLVDGGLQFGEYTIKLALTNWVGGEGVGRITIVKDPPPPGKGRGPLGNENAKPAVSIKGLTERRPFRDQDVLLDAVGELALCLPGAERESLSYRWNLVCVSGYCQTPIDLNTAVQSPLVPTLLLPRGLLKAGTVYDLICTASQFFLQSTARVVVKVVFRPVVAIMSGIGQTGFAPFGRTMDLTASDSFDPDASSSGLTSADLVYTWGCSVQQIAEGTNDTQRIFVPCPDGTVAGYGTTGHATFNNTFHVLGATYIISVNVTRPAIPAGISLGISDGWFGMGSASSTITLIAGEPVMVRAFLCDPSLRGQSTLCNEPLLRNRVSAREHVVLKADAIPSSTGIVTSYLWSGLSEPLRASMVLTVLNDQILLLKPNMFNLGHTIRLRCTARDSNANDGYADIQFSINVPPLGGTLTVVPSTGTALLTEFEMRADFWLADPENLPLKYRFFYVAVDEFMYDMPLSRTQTQLLNTILVQGAANASYGLDVGVEVIDSIGDYTRVVKQVPVLPVPSDPVELQAMVSGVITGRIDRFLRLGDYISAQATVAVVAGTLNQAVDVCGAGQAESSACKLRQSTRTQLFLKLQDVTARVLATATQLEDQGRVLSTITYRPSEIDFALIRAIADYVDWSLAQARKPEALSRGAVLADVYASVVDQLMAATKLLVGTLLRRNAQIGAVAAEEEWTRSREGAWTRQSIPVPTARNIQWQLLRTVSTLSSVSLQASVPDQLPIVITKPAFTLNSSRLASAGFEGFTSMIENTFAQFVLPPTLFANLEGPTPPSFEVMMALYQFEDNPLPGANGPQVSFEIRQFGSNVPLVFESSRTNKVQMLVPYVEATLTREFLPVTGQTQTPFCKVFNRESWSWITNDISFVEEADEFVRMDVDLKGSHFAVGEVLADCEDEPLGPLIKDQCGKCGGDDGTCSGCDGIPGTGRFKNCSGHGACNGPQCQCEPFYYDIMCATFCSEAVTCSGHGVCDFATGKSCFCNTGWGQPSEAQIVYPGPFCGSLLTSGGVAGGGGEDGKLSENDIQWLVTYVVPAVAGGLVFCLAGCWFMTRKKRQLAQLHRTIIEFPQPQLEIPAEERPDAIIATPDDNGWTNVKLPEATADFGYGPNSGQLASAIAASTRTSIGRMSTQRIDQRTKIMKKQISSKKTPSHYIDGPRLENGNPRESDEEDEDLENGDGRVMNISNHPEWSDGKL